MYNYVGGFGYSLVKIPAIALVSIGQPVFTQLQDACLQAVNWCTRLATVSWPKLD